MSEIIAALLGGLIAIIGYFAIIETLNYWRSVYLSG